MSAVGAPSPVLVRPILDLQVWVENEQGEKPKLFYQFYRKPVSNWLLIPANSAVSTSVKRTALTQYGLRILRNTKPEIEWKLRANMLSEFSERMRDSGYGEKFRMEILSSILRGWDKMTKRQETGGRPINRPRNYQEAERRTDMWRKKANWYKTGTRL